MRKNAYFVWPKLALLFCLPVSAQKTTQPRVSNLVISRTFLRALFPELSDKQFVMTVEGGFVYDSPLDLEDPFKYGVRLYVGAEPKGSTPPANFVRPCPPGSTQAYQASSGGFIGSDCTPPAPWWYQFLQASFRFNEAGQLESFGAQGDSTSDPAARKAYERAIANEKYLTSRAARAALKRAGAKYGPDDKAEFVKHLPLDRLAKFLGKMELVSVEPPFEEDDSSGLYADFHWVVKVKATRPDATTMMYRLQFEQFQGHLTALCELSSKAPCNIWRTPG